VIGGSLACRDANLGKGSEQTALVAARLTVRGDVLLDKVISAGTVIMAGAGIGGRLCCRGAKIDNNTAGDSLAADGVKVGGSALLCEQFAATGAVQLSHASIGGSLHCSGASMGANKNGNALVAQQVNVTGGVLLDDGFAAAGAVSLRGASIGRELRWDPGSPASGEVNLEGARAQQLTDNWARPRALGYWPAGRLRLGGFVYDGFGGGYPATVNQRLAWIRTQYATQPKHSQTSKQAPARSGPPASAVTGGAGNDQPPALADAAAPFATQPYKQLADAYRRAGQEDDARAVEIAMRRDLRKHGISPGPRHPSTGY